MTEILHCILMKLMLLLNQGHLPLPSPQQPKAMLSSLTRSSASTVNACCAALASLAVSMISAEGHWNSALQQPSQHPLQQLFESMAACRWSQAAEPGTHNWPGRPSGLQWARSGGARGSLHQVCTRGRRQGQCPGLLPCGPAGRLEGETCCLCRFTDHGRLVEKVGMGL